MRFLSRHDESIETLEQWKVRGAPAGATHWKAGRSACELARDWVEGDAVERVTSLLSLRPELAGLTLDTGVAEKKTRFDDNPRGPRNHDLLVRGSIAAGPVVVGVEGKADEPFDKPLRSWRDEAVANNAASGAPARVDRLTRIFFGTTLDEDSEHPPLALFGYQLLSTLAGTLADAKLDGAAYAVVLIHEFRTPLTATPKHEENGKVLDAFLTRFYGETPERATADGAWITPPRVVSGDDAWVPEAIPVSFAKMVTKVPSLVEG